MEERLKEVIDFFKDYDEGISRSDDYLIGDLKRNKVKIGDIISPEDRELLMIVTKLEYSNEDYSDGRCEATVVYGNEDDVFGYKIGDPYGPSISYNCWYKYDDILTKNKEPEFDF